MEGILVFISELTFHNVSLKRVKKTYLEKTEGIWQSRDWTKTNKAKNKYFEKLLTENQSDGQHGPHPKQLGWNQMIEGSAIPVSFKTPDVLPIDSINKTLVG